MKHVLYSTLTAVLTACILSASAPAAVFKSVRNKQFIVTGISTGTIPVFSDVFIFQADGSFVMKKLESYGEGAFYEYAPGVFYCIFSNQAGIDMQYVEVFGISLATIAEQMIAGMGIFMIDYRLEPLLFFGIEVFQPEADGYTR